MIRSHQSSRQSDFPAQLELPTALLKRVLTRRGLRLGSRILVAGCGDGELVAFLDGIAYSVDAVDDCVERVEASRKRFPHFQFEYASFDESQPVFHDQFDLILVQDLFVYRDNLMDLKTQLATANLLTFLKPGGELVFIRKQNRSRIRVDGHKSSCWRRHLSCFPGELETSEYRESLFQSARWDWIAGHRDHLDYFTVTLETPQEARSQSAWREFARRDVSASSESCCAAGLTESNAMPHAA